MSDPVRHRFTIADLDALDERERASLVDGELLRDAMTSFEHGDAQSSLVGAIKQRFGGGGPPEGDGGWWIGTEVNVVYTSERVLRHDIAGWPKTDVPERPVGKRVDVRPGWVCEILSTNRNHDLIFTRRVLHAAEVPFYWTVDLEEPLLTVLRYHPDGYLIVATVAPGERAELPPFDAVELDVKSLFGDID